MQIEEVTEGAPEEGNEYYFSAVLFEGFPFWTAGPHGESSQQVKADLALFHGIHKVQIVKTYVPSVH